MEKEKEHNFNDSSIKGSMNISIKPYQGKRTCKYCMDEGYSDIPSAGRCTKCYEYICETHLNSERDDICVHCG